TNQRQRDRFFKKITGHFGGETGLHGKTFAFWGLAFKPNTDDIREAPALTLIRKAVGCGVTARGYDPVAASNVQKELGSTVEIVDDIYDCAAGADALVISTDWAEFKSPDFAKLAEVMNGRVIFDGRNLYRRQHFAELGFNYYSVGREPVLPA
ncbi:MAG: UDP binding domain-containing protein, partial [Planctomycetota bacterium]